MKIPEIMSLEISRIQKKILVCQKIKNDNTLFFQISLTMRDGSFGLISHYLTSKPIYLCTCIGLYICIFVYNQIK